MVGEPDATMQPTPQDNQLMSKHRVLGFKPHFDLNGEARTARTNGADTALRSGNDDVPWQQGNSRPRTEALTQPVRLRAGTTALRRFVQ
jgi:hypothetical protein